MKNKTSISLLIILVVAFAVIATVMGIFSDDGTGQYQYQSIRGRTVTIYGKGLYKHMSAEVAPQGIAQDYVTLLVGVPLLLCALWITRQGSKKGQFLLAGTLGYFLVTYLFYTVMGMYNQLFLVYIILMGTSFYAFILTLLSFETKDLSALFKSCIPTKVTGGFLIFNSIAIGLLWLSIVIPPLLNGSIIPVQAEHYTTLIVQGLDLGILLPAAFLCGILWMKKRPLGYLLTPVYFIFLSLLMTALTAKVMAMAILGYNVIPVVVIIPTFNLISIACTIAILKNVIEQPTSTIVTSHEKSVIV
jgi:hypothetical protein